jgi:crotonobetainyl-CoA:carnitine CoA-transferase CaiB-like acyl-CoA transferase
MKYGRNLVRFGRTSDVPGRPAPLLGEQTREVLEGAGYTEAEVDRLYEMGVVRTRTPREELPEDA